MPNHITGRWMYNNVFAAGLFMVSPLNGELVNLTHRYGKGYAVAVSPRGIPRDQPIPLGVMFMMFYEEDSTPWLARFSQVRPKYGSSDDLGQCLDLSTLRVVNT